MFTAVGLKKFDKLDMAIIYII